MKTCSSCRCEKQDSEFYKRKFSNDGLESQCKRCRKTGCSKVLRCATAHCRVRTVNKYCAICIRDQKSHRLNTVTKQCQTCHVTKTLVEFGIRKHADDGRCVTCKKCSGKKHASRAGQFAVARKYHPRDESLGFACSHMLSVGL
jgi:hypothetical protein